MTTVVNLEDYGLETRPDGTYADAALASALGAAATRVTSTPLGSFYGGLRIRVNGLYNLDGSHALPINTHLEGGGKTTGFVCSGDGLVLANQGYENSDTDSSITRLALYSTRPDRTGIFAAGGGGMLVEDVFLAGWQYGVDLLDTNSVTVERVYSGGATFGAVESTAVRLRGEANQNRIVGCRFNSWRGIEHAGGTHNVIRDCNINNPSVGVLITSASDLHLECNIEAALVAGVLIDRPGTACGLNVALVRCLMSGGPLLRVTSGSVVYGLTLQNCRQLDGVHMVETSGIDIVGVFAIGNRHYGSGAIFENEVTGHESVFYASSAFHDPTTRANTGIGTVLPQRTLDVRDGPVGLRLRDGGGVRTDLP